MEPFGELALIADIRRRFALSGGQRSVLCGIGDDCAVLRPKRGSDLLVTTDFTLEGRHFRRDLHPPESVGHRCLARGLSDLAAMGGVPSAAFLSLALPPSMSRTASGRRWIERFFLGFSRLADRHAVSLAGGDTAEAPGKELLADIVLIGNVPQGQALRRSGARTGDLLFVTGALGGSAAELEGMMRRKVLPPRNSLQLDHPQMFPEPRLKVGQALLRRGLATACIDLSDGVSSDLAHLCRESRLGASVDAAVLPVHPFAIHQAEEDTLRLALHGGEDYELLFTAPPEARMPRTIAGVALTCIGRMTAKNLGVNVMDVNGTRRTLEPAGWEHFRRGTKR